MPLLDHFHPPLEDEIPWTTLHAGWATRIADNLNEHWLGEEYIAAEIATSGLHPEVDIPAYERPSIPSPIGGGGNAAVATLARPAWQVAEPEMTFTAIFPEVFEVQVLTSSGRRKLVGVIAVKGLRLAIATI